MSELPLIVRALRHPLTTPDLGLPEWDLLIRQARRGNLLARLQSVLGETGVLEAVPHQPRQHLEWAGVTAQRHAQAVRAEVARVRTALEGRPVVLLKGAAYAMAGLPPSAGRIFSDIDIMVPRAGLADTESLLMARGWQATHHDAYDQRYYRQWMHELPPLRHILRGSVIDVHHAILPGTMRVHPDSAKLLAAVVAIPAQDNLYTFAPVDMVLHSAAHLFYEGELYHGLRDLYDLDALLRHFSAAPGFWRELVARAREMELSRVLFYALRYTRLLLDTPVPDTAADAVRSGGPGAALLSVMDALYLRALVPTHASCDRRLTGVARKCLYIRANWLRMPPLKLARHLFHKAFISPRE